MRCLNQMWAFFEQFVIIILIPNKQVDVDIDSNP